MNIDEFIEASLKQIIEGVRRAQNATKNPNKHPTECDVVNPNIMYSADNAPKGKYYATTGRNLVHFVDFDIAVTTDTSSKAKGGVGLIVAGIGLGAKGQVSTQDSVVSRIKFQVPITLPKSSED